MTIATLKGRIQTKALTYLVLAGLTSLFAMLWGTAMWQVLTIAIATGLILETIWGLTIEYQPGWLTFVLGAVEFAVITDIILILATPITLSQAALFYWTSWIIIQLFLIYLIPIIDTDWADNGHELI